MGEDMSGWQKKNDGRGFVRGGKTIPERPINEKAHTRKPH